MRDSLKSERGFYHIIAAVVIVVAIIGIYIGLKEVQRTQVLKSRAQVEEPSNNPSSAPSSQLVVDDKQDDSFFDPSTISLKVYESAGFPEIIEYDGQLIVNVSKRLVIGVVGNLPSGKNYFMHVCPVNLATVNRDTKKDCLIGSTDFKVEQLNLSSQSKMGIFYSFKERDVPNTVVGFRPEYYFILTDEYGNPIAYKRVLVER